MDVEIRWLVREQLQITMESMCSTSQIYKIIFSIRIFNFVKICSTPESKFLFSESTHNLKQIFPTITWYMWTRSP